MIERAGIEDAALTPLDPYWTLPPTLATATVTLAYEMWGTLEGATHLVCRHWLPTPRHHVNTTMT